MKCTAKWLAIPVLALVLVGSISCRAMAAGSPPLWWDLQHPGWYINGYNDPDRDIWEIHNDAELLRQHLGQPKHLALRYGSFPPCAPRSPGNMSLLQHVQAWLLKPDGHIEDVSLFVDERSVAAEVPEPEASSGIYLLGSHYSPDDRDIDGDGKLEKVHLYAKFLLRHVTESLSHGGEKNTFFHSPLMPLEIGPVRAGRYSGIIQISHRPYEMAVFYRGKPLAGAEVTILTERGWSKTVQTDQKGRFMAVPLESRGEKRNWESYLYTVRHHDRQRGEYHVASMPMIVDPPWPEWTHCLTSFVLWSFAGTTFAAFLAATLIMRSRRRNRLRLARFEAAKRPGGPSCA